MYGMEYQCQGDCATHVGKPKDVLVTGFGWKDYPAFYCENAIQVDKDNGFEVKIIGDKNDG